MALTAQEVFAETVRVLPSSEQLRLAALILQHLAQSEVVIVNRSDTWSRARSTRFNHLLVAVCN